MVHLCRLSFVTKEYVRRTLNGQLVNRLYSRLPNSNYTLSTFSKVTPYPLTIPSLLADKYNVSHNPYSVLKGCGVRFQSSKSNGKRHKKIYTYCLALSFFTTVLFLNSLLLLWIGEKRMTYDEFIRLFERGEISHVFLFSPYGFYAKRSNQSLNVILVLMDKPIKQSEMLEKLHELEVSRDVPLEKRANIKAIDGFVVLSSTIIRMFNLILACTIISLGFRLRKQNVTLKEITDICLKGYPRKFSSSSPSSTGTQAAETAKTEKPDMFKPYQQNFHRKRPPTVFYDPFGGGVIESVTSDVTFKDVAGLHSVKEEVVEFVSYMKNPSKYEALGAKLPKGALLLGPPGTGKTLLIKALANEAAVPFHYKPASEFVERIGGLGARRVRNLFEAARSNRPSIIFIDELDSIGHSRARGNSKGINSESEQTLNQLLVEMDGMDSQTGVVVFGATNRSDDLDAALLRPGRFDRHIMFDFPNLAERKELCALYVGKYQLASEILVEDFVDRLAHWTTGMTGADISNLCNEAALITARRDNYEKGIQKADFELAFERIISGSAKQNNPLSPHERHLAAVQESGRALLAWLLPSTSQVPIKISIVPRTGFNSQSGSSLGFSNIISEQRYLYNMQELADRMTVLLGGRAAEQLCFPVVSDVSHRYLKQANKLAMIQVREMGMSDTVGNLSFRVDNEFDRKPYSQMLESLMELEAKKLVSTAFDRALKLLDQNKDKLELLVDELLKRESLNYDDICQLLKCERPTFFKPRL